MVKNLFPKLLLLLLVFSNYIFSHAQITYPGKPIFKAAFDTTFIPLLELQVDAPLQKKSKSGSGINFKVDEFAIPVDVSINTEDYGVWLEYEELNKKIWLIRIYSENAASLNVIFDAYKLLPGVDVFLYNKNQSEVLGALNYKNNKTWNRLATTPIRGDEIYVELQMPIYAKEFGELNIGKIGVEKKPTTNLKSVQDRWYGASATCHVNVNCFQDENFQNQKKSVCRIIYSGGWRCTGTLINNLAYDNTPYILTAAHCFDTEEVANDAIFTFNYESPDCVNSDVPLQSVSGASVVSTADELDFVLLKLSEKVPDEYGAAYSGWDARGYAPSNSYVLHHPQGDIRKISIDEDQAVTTSYPGFAPDSFWEVYGYETGSSEAGSSGAGLISEENYLVGTLTAGGDTCSDPIQDVYQKFSHMYNDYLDPENQLKHWLDPKGLGFQSCNYSDGYQKIRDEYPIISNVLVSDNIEIKKQEQGWGYLAGHNYQGNTLFAEHFQINGSKYLYGANIDLASFSIGTSADITFMVWEGGNEPGNIFYEKTYGYSEIEEGIRNMKYEIDFDSTLLINNSFYFGYRISYQTDTFAVKTVSTSRDNNSAYTFINNSWQSLQFDNQDKPSKLAVEILASDYHPVKGIIPDTNSIAPVHLYPNPSKDHFQVYLKNGKYSNLKVKIYDLSGRVVFAEEWDNPELNVRITHNLPRGVYILNVLGNNRRIDTKKIIVY